MKGKMVLYFIVMMLGTLVSALVFYDAMDSVCRRESWWWKLVVGMVLVFATVKSVPFTKRQECNWLFFLAIFAFFPFNIRLSTVLVNGYLRDSLWITKMLFGIAACICFFSAEEIFLAILARVLWPRQDDVFLYAKKKIDAEEEWD